MATASREGVVSDFNFDMRLQLRECLRLHRLLQRMDGLGRSEDEHGATDVEDARVGGGTGRMTRPQLLGMVPSHRCHEEKAGTMAASTATSRCYRTRRGCTYCRR